MKIFYQSVNRRGDYKMENVAERNSMQNIEVTKDNEMDLVQGLLSAADFRTDDEMQTEIQIKRKGKLFFSFKIRPLSEEELLNARRKSVVKMANPNNPKLPPIEKEVKIEEFTAWKIYLATVDRENVWENPAVMNGLERKGFSVLQGIDVINTVLRAGEKDAIDDQIDKLSGFYDSEVTVEDYAKN